MNGFKHLLFVFITLLSTISAATETTHAPLDERVLLQRVCDHLLTDAGRQEFFDTSEVISEEGATGIPYLFEHEGRNWVVKKYSHFHHARVDQLGFEWFKRNSHPEDSVRVVDFISLSNIHQIHSFIDGVTVQSFLNDHTQPLELRNKIARDFMKFNKDVRDRILSQYPEELVKHRTITTVFMETSPGAYSAISGQHIQVRHGGGEYDFYLIPHAENIIVENGTHQLWLIDPR